MRRLNHFRVITLANILLSVVLTPFSPCQQTNPVLRKWPYQCLNTTGDRSRIATSYRAIRSFEDPGTHQHWLLLRNLSRPAAPAVLVERSLDSSCAGSSLEKSDQRSLSGQRYSLPVIQAGDYIVVSEHTRITDAELEATALNPAAIGESLSVRLKFGGRAVNAIATAPGRATLSEAGNEVRR